MKYLLLLSFFLPFTSASGQSQKSDTIRVILLGTFHFGQTSDKNKTNFADLFSRERQKQLDALTTQLATARINRIFIERPTAQQSRTDSLYQLYVAGKLTDTVASRPEAVQIGFRLAQKSKLNKVYCADFKQPLSEDLLKAFGNKLGNDEAFPAPFFRSKEYPFKDKSQALNLKNTPLSPYYLKINNPYHRQKSQYDFLHYALMSTKGDDYAGVSFTTSWYERNLKIFANILRELQPTDRTILVLFGSSHTAILRQFFQNHPKFKIIELESILK